MDNFSHTVCAIDINDALDVGVGCWALLNSPNLHFQVAKWFLRCTM